MFYSLWGRRSPWRGRWQTKNISMVPREARISRRSADAMQLSFVVLTKQFVSTQRPTSLWTAGLIFSIERQCPTFRTASGPDRSSGWSRPHRRGGGGCGGHADVVHHRRLLRTPSAPQPRRPVRRVPDGRDRPATPQGTMVRYSREPQNDVKCTFCWLSVRDSCPGAQRAGLSGRSCAAGFGEAPRG